MCDQHVFVFDVDKAYADQVVEALESSPRHPISNPEAPRDVGVYALYRGEAAKPVYVGVATGQGGLASRLRDHFNKVSGRIGIMAEEITCRFLVIRQTWEAARAENAIIERYRPEWNGIPGFSMHVPGSGRPGKAGYVNEWDKKFPQGKRN